jgi:hypothetical protein
MNYNGYKEEERMVYSLTRFAVLENYEMVYENKELKWISNEDKSFRAKIKNNSVYNPLEDAKELYTELNKVDIHKPKSFLKFVETYGLPFGETIEAGNPDIKVFHSMNIEEFSERLDRYKEIFSYWKVAQNRNEKEMERLKKEFGNEALGGLLLNSLGFEIDEVAHTEFGKKDSTVMTPEYARWLEIKDKKPVDAIYQLISILVNEQYTERVQTSYVDVPCKRKGKVVYEKKMAPAVYLNDLFEVAYHQMTQSIYKEMKVGICEHCGFPFEITHERQKFCPPMLGRKGSTCENTHNKKIKRERKKERQE